jgi:hypothetical protein
MNEEVNRLQLKSGVLLLDKYTSSIEFVTDKTNKVLPFKRQSMIDSETLLRLLSEGSFGFNCPDVLPKNCRYFSFTPWNNNIRLVMEQTPITRSVRVDLDLSFPLESLKQQGKLEAYGYKDYKLKNPPHVLRLAFPYIIFIIDLTLDLGYRRCSVFYRTAPLTSVYDFLLKSNMLNVEVSGSMCIRGDESDKAVKSLGALQEKATLSERIDQVLNRVWLNDFNRDFHGSHVMYKDVPQVGNLLEWQYFSKADPMFVFKVPWFQHERNLLAEIGLGSSKNKDNLDEPVIQKIQQIISGQANKKLFIERSMAESLFIEDGNLHENKTPEVEEGDEGIEELDNDSSQSFTIAVGDQLVIDKKNYYINALKFTKDYVDVLELEDEEGNKSDHKIDLRLKKKIINFLKKKPSNSIVTKNGKTIKRGDLIAFKVPGYEKLLSADEVRVSRDGLSEIKCGRTVYLVDFVDFDVIDKNKLEFEGIKFQKGDKFLVKTSDRFPRKVFVGNICTFEEFREGKLCFTKIGTTTKLKIDVLGHISDTVKKIEEELLPIPAVRIGNKVVVSDDLRSIFITKNRDVIISGDVGYFNSEHTNWTNHIPKMLLEEGKRFFLPSCDIDIDLRVGDNVIVTAWNSPLDLLKIRKITAFIFDPKRRRIEITTTIGDDKSTEQTFPIFEVYDGVVSAGCIRKASYSVDGLTIGMEVVPKQRVPGFLKSKPCRISAFIVDAGIPLVLCSNFHTFWLTENNRRLFTFNSFPSSASECEFTPKFTPQFGDVLGNHSYDYDIYELMFHTLFAERKTWMRLPSFSKARWISHNASGFPRYQNFYFYGLIPQRMKNVPGNVIPDMFSWYSNSEVSRDIIL